MLYFGDPWPSGICEGGTRIATPVGELCEMCTEPIGEGDQGTLIGTVRGEEGAWRGGWAPVHKECSYRAVVGGIGHHLNHDVWCIERGDPDGGLSYRRSALMVWSLTEDRARKS